MSKAKFLALGLIVFATLLAVGSPSKSANAQTPPPLPPALPGQINIQKICVGDLEGVVEFDLVLDANVDVSGITGLELLDLIFLGLTPVTLDTLLEGALDVDLAILCGTNSLNVLPGTVVVPGIGLPLEVPLLELLEFLGLSLTIDVDEILAADANIVVSLGGDCADGVISLAELLLGAECIITNTAAEAELRITKLCSTGNTTPLSVFTVAVTGEITTPVLCGQTVQFDDLLTTGPVTITETISGTGTFGTAIVCTNGDGQTGLVISINLDPGDDVTCFIINVLDVNPTDGVPPVLPPNIIVGPIIIELPPINLDVNTPVDINVGGNTNNNTSSSNPTVTNNQTQNQTNNQDQATGDVTVNSGGATGTGTSTGGSGTGGQTNVAGATGGGGQTNVPATRTVSPPRTGDGGLASSESSNASTYALAGMVVVLLGGAAAVRAWRS